MRRVVRAIELCERGEDGFSTLGISPDQLLESTLATRFLSYRSFRSPGSLVAVRLWRAKRRCSRARALVAVVVGHARQRRDQQGMICLRTQWQAPIVIRKAEATIFQHDRELSPREDLPKAVAEHGEQDPIPQCVFRRQPIDVEEVGIDGPGAVLEHIVEPGVLVAGDAHVIGTQSSKIPISRALPGSDRARNHRSCRGRGSDARDR